MAIFKFVVTNEPDSKLISDFDKVMHIINKFGIRRELVYIMPMAATKKELLEREQETIEFCKENGFIYCPRLHVQVWGNKRGV